MNDVPRKITTDKTTPGYWRVTLNNPPINAIDDRMYDELFDLVEEIEAEPSLTQSVRSTVASGAWMVASAAE